MLNHKGIKTDSRGYAVIPYATPYRVNQVALDVTTVGNDVELENAIANKIPTDGALVRATLTTRQGAKAMFIVRHAKDVLPSARWSRQRMTKPAVSSATAAACI